SGNTTSDDGSIVIELDHVLVVIRINTINFKMCRIPITDDWWIKLEIYKIVLTELSWIFYNGNPGKACKPCFNLDDLHLRDNSSICISSIHRASKSLTKSHLYLIKSTCFQT